MINSVKVAHSLPGRSRLTIKSSLRPVLVECLFREISGIYSATYNEVTGSLILYHNCKLTLKKILKYIKLYLLNRKREEKQEWLHYLSIVVCAGVFFASWYVNRNPLLMIWSPIVHKVVIATALLTSLDVMKDGVLNVLKEHKPNANTLTATSILAAIYIGNPASALVITMMSTVSELLTQYTTEKTKNYIRSVLQLNTNYAWRINKNGEEEKVETSKIIASDRIKVYVGERVPVDGTVLSGTAAVDESSITGEYMPKEVTTSMKVYAGSILQSGELTVVAEKVGNDTAISRILQLLEEAQEKRAPIQNMTDTLAEKMVPVSFGLALLTFLLTRNVNRAMNMLVIDFVCGIKLSTATALYASIGKAAKNGAIVKGSNHIESMSKLGTVILDKTGTITEGSPIVKDVLTYNGYSKEQVVQFAAVAEKNSSHPIADAILKKAKEWGIKIPNRDQHSQMETIVGKGISASLDGKQIVVGSLRFMREMKVNIEEYLHKINQEDNVIYVAYNHSLVGVISIFDKIRNGMYQTVQHLRHQGINEIVMITGDKRAVAKETALRLGLDWYHAETLPSEKAEFVKNYGQRHTVMMVGDGINDAPALAHAQIGVTMGSKRTDIASEASDIIITGDNPTILPELVGLSKLTMNKIKQNFIATFVINGAAILLGALGVITPVLGAAIHNAATIGVVLNSATILWKGDKRIGTEILHFA
ncbi:cation-translocating P-type ATPase [Bacillus sp. OK048]|uniref:heavy metal translocating P-type ATPase n=1 Tax=Bacillus sp. OK048 TaxID=1882761 RepID=UPI00088E48FC|nr:cation-translocating P-type ATPase [Bacillus sp. OK048]SDN51415.1 cation-transporting P-type ATPase C [Bacillus sp. OK048]